MSTISPDTEFSRLILYDVQTYRIRSVSFVRVLYSRSPVPRSFEIRAGVYPGAVRGSRYLSVRHGHPTENHVYSEVFSVAAVFDWPVCASQPPEQPLRQKQSATVTAS